MSEMKNDQSLGELFSRMTNDVSTLLRKEVELAKVETKEEISKTAKASQKLGGAAVAGYFAAIMLSFAIAFGLDSFLPTWLAFLIVAVAYGIAAAVLGQKGKEEIKTVNLTPEETIDTLKEDVQWAKTRKQ